MGPRHRALYRVTRMAGRSRPLVGKCSHVGLLLRGPPTWFYVLSKYRRLLFAVVVVRVYSRLLHVSIEYRVICRADLRILLLFSRGKHRRERYCLAERKEALYALNNGCSGNIS